MIWKIILGGRFLSREWPLIAARLGQTPRDNSGRLEQFLATTKFKPVWVTNDERLDAGEDHIFVQPPDSLYVIKFQKECSMGDSVSLFRNARSNFMMIVHRRQIQQGDWLRYTSLVIQVARPRHEQGHIVFDVHTMNGSLSGSNQFRHHERVTVQRLKNRFREDLPDGSVKPSTKAICCDYLRQCVCVFRFNLY